MSHTSRMPHRGLIATLILLSAVALLSTTAWSSGSEVYGEAGATTDLPGREVVDRAPELDMAERVVLSQDRTQGNASLEYGEAEKGDGDTVTVAVDCEGKGRIDVELRPLAASFPLDCRDGEVTGIHNQFTLAGADRAGTVTVTAAPGVHWSLSVGRGEPAEQDLSD